VLDFALRESAIAAGVGGLVRRSAALLVSKASVYRLLKAHDLITSPAFILMKAADSFAHPTSAPNQLWQTDFTHLRVIGRGWFYLSTVLDDFSRYILDWKLEHLSEVAETNDTAVSVPPTFADLYRFPLAEKGKSRKSALSALNQRDREFESISLPQRVGANRYR
jgi:Integrase core domain